MSKALSALNTVEQFTDTLRHEIAHAIVGPGHHHNRVWKQAAVLVGARPERCYSSTDVVTVKARWTGTCQDCGKQINRHRMTTLVRFGGYHTKCRGEQFDGNITWVKNG